MIKGVRAGGATAQADDPAEQRQHAAAPRSCRQEEGEEGGRLLHVAHRQADRRGEEAEG